MSNPAFSLPVIDTEAEDLINQIPTGAFSSKTRSSSLQSALTNPDDAN